MLNKVWLLVRCASDGYTCTSSEVIYVFSSLAKAEEAEKKLSVVYRDDCLSIEEWPLDEFR